jgi:hypothetical protein
MKKKFKLIVLVISVLFCGIAYGQDEFVSLTSAQFLKGLDNKDYINSVMMANEFVLIKHYKMVNVRSGIYDYWQYETEIFVDMIYRPGRENYIIVRIYKDLADFAERLIETFPHKTSDKVNDNLSTIKVNHINKEKAYRLFYSQEGKNMGVYVWFDDPFYFFEYTTVE